jgi:hypothetical protein
LTPSISERNWLLQVCTSDIRERARIMGKWLSYLGGHSLTGFHDNSFEVRDGSERLKKLRMIDAAEADAESKRHALAEISLMEQEQRERFMASRAESGKRGRQGLKAAAMAKGWKVSGKG